MASLHLGFGHWAVPIPSPGQTPPPCIARGFKSALISGPDIRVTTRLYTPSVRLSVLRPELPKAPSYPATQIKTALLTTKTSIMSALKLRVHIFNCPVPFYIFKYDRTLLGDTLPIVGGVWGEEGHCPPSSIPRLREWRGGSLTGY